MSLRARPSVEAVLLDAGGVLVLPDPSAFRARLRPFGVEPDDARCRQAAYLGMSEVDRLRRTDYAAVNRFQARFLGVPDRHLDAAVQAIEQVYNHDRGVAIDGAAEQLLRLSAAGLRLGVVSNANGEIEAELLSNGICSRDGNGCAAVECVIDSRVVGVEKPDPAIFALALDALRLPPERCVYIGDSVHFDVRGARAAGIEAVHLTPFDNCKPADHDDVPSLQAFVDRLLGQMEL